MARWTPGWSTLQGVTLKSFAFCISPGTAVAVERSRAEYFLRSGFGGTVSDVTASSPEATGESFHFSYTYNRKDYSDWSDHQINMPGLPFGLPMVKDDEAHSKDPSG